MLYIIAIVFAFVFLAMSEGKNKRQPEKEITFTEWQIEYLQSINLINEDEIQKYTDTNK